MQTGLPYSHTRVEFRANFSLPHCRMRSSRSSFESLAGRPKSDCICRERCDDKAGKVMHRILASNGQQHFAHYYLFETAALSRKPALKSVLIAVLQVAVSRTGVSVTALIQLRYACSSSPRQAAFIHDYEFSSDKRIYVVANLVQNGEAPPQEFCPRLDCPDLKRRTPILFTERIGPVLKVLSAPRAQVAQRAHLPSEGDCY